MNKHLLNFFWIPAFLGIVLFGYVEGATPAETLQQAAEAYKSGETAPNIAQRKENFNLALALYTQLEESSKPTHGNGKLYYNIANTYFQLEEYPWAILYYYRAMALMPRNEKVIANLNIALQRQGLNPVPEKGLFERIFFLHTFLSVPEKLQILLFIAVLGLVLGSIYIWSPGNKIRKTLFLLAGLLLLVLLSLGYSRFLMPIEGVIVKSAALYRDAGEQYAKVSDQPIVAGTKTQILDVQENGLWLKVLTPSGEVGYLPNSVIRLI